MKDENSLKISLSSPLTSPVPPSEPPTPLLPEVIIVSGLPATGKTTLARRLADDLNLPLVTKDEIKERLFDKLGWSDREWSQRLGVATFALLYYFIEVQLKAGRSFIAEANFRPDRDNPPFRELKSRYDFQPIQIVCVTEGEKLLERYRARGESGQRHPGHVDHLTYDELGAQLLKGRQEPLDLGGLAFEVDTTDYAKVDYESLLQAVRQGLV